MKGPLPTISLLLLLLLLSLDPGAGEYLGSRRPGIWMNEIEEKGEREVQEEFGVRSPLNTWPHCFLVMLLPPSTTCCTQLYRQPLSNKLLKEVIRVELQEADGDCHLRAFV